MKRVEKRISVREHHYLALRKRWEFMNSIGVRDLEKSIKLAKSIINNSENMVSMIFPLLTFFSRDFVY